MSNYKCPRKFERKLCRCQEGFYYGYVNETDQIMCRVTDFAAYESLVVLAAELTTPVRQLCTKCSQVKEG